MKYGPRIDIRMCNEHIELYTCSLLTKGTQSTTILLNIQQIGKILRSLIISSAGEEAKYLELSPTYNHF